MPTEMHIKVMKKHYSRIVAILLFTGLTGCAVSQNSLLAEWTNTSTANASETVEADTNSASTDDPTAPTTAENSPEESAGEPAFVPLPPPTKPTYTPLQFTADEIDLAAMPTLKPGSKGDAVRALQEMLLAAGFYRGAIDGIYAQHTSAAVMAAQKALDLPVKSRWKPQDWEVLLAYQGPNLPARTAQPDRVEVDLDRQLLYLIKGDQVVAIMPTSGGNGKPYRDQNDRKVKAKTPLGNYEIYRRLNGWRESYLGRLYRPWYFLRGYAVHGSHSVPPKPASHGCLRVTMWDADFLADELFLGMPINIWVDDGGSSTIIADNETETMLSQAQ